MNKLYIITSIWSKEYVVATSLNQAVAKLDRKLKKDGVYKPGRQIKSIELLGEVVL